MGTAIKFLDPRTGEWMPQVFDDTVILGSSRALGCEVIAEHGLSHGFAPDGIAVAGHLVSMNLNDTPLRIEYKRGKHYQTRELPPRSLFVHPAGVPMYQRNGKGAVRFCALEIPPAWADRVVGVPLDVTPQCGLVDARLAQLFDALVLELDSGCESGALFLESLAIAFTVRFARALGQLPEPARPTNDDRMRRVLELVQAQLARSITVDELARLAGLSVAHFSREFKRHTGETPHAFVTGQRLAQARRLLVAGSSIADVASRSGFSDQSHLSRWFQRRYGMTPGAFRRSLR